MRVYAKLVGMPRKARVPTYVEPIVQEAESGVAVDLPDGSTVRDLEEALARRTPEVDLLVDKILVNGADATPDTPLKDGDAVVLFGPTAYRE